MLLTTAVRSQLFRYRYSVIFQLYNGSSENKFKYINPFAIRTFYTNPSLLTSFNVQDGEDFKERVLQNKTPSIVDFHASWCGPCKLLGPRLETIVAAKDGKVQLAKIDIDDNTDLALEYNVSSVPTVLAVKNGKVVDQFIGLQDDDKIESFVNKLTL